MTLSQRSPMLGLIMLLSACVTINVYFPAAAAEKAADRFIRDIYGEEQAAPEQQQTPADSEKANPQSSLLDWFIPAAHAAQPDIDISTPGASKLKSRMQQRHGQLSPYYASGAIGMTNTGLLSLRDPKQVPLKSRNQVKVLLSDENKDRNALYNEVARANGHPEWANDIRATFARRWVGNAPSGWWYQNANGDWLKKQK